MRLIATKAVLVFAITLATGVVFYELALGSTLALMLALIGQLMVCMGVLLWQPRRK
jgi:hypothetical protein